MSCEPRALALIIMHCLPLQEFELCEKKCRMRQADHDIESESSSLLSPLCEKFGDHRAPQHQGFASWRNVYVVSMLTTDSGLPVLSKEG